MTLTVVTIDSPDGKAWPADTIDIVSAIDGVTDARLESEHTIVCYVPSADARATVRSLAMKIPGVAIRWASKDPL